MSQQECDTRDFLPKRGAGDLEHLIFALEEEEEQEDSRRSQPRGRSQDRTRTAEGTACPPQARAGTLLLEGFRICCRPVSSSRSLLGCPCSLLDCLLRWRQRVTCQFLSQAWSGERTTSHPRLPHHLGSRAGELRAVNQDCERLTSGRKGVSSAFTGEETKTSDKQNGGW